MDAAPSSYSKNCSMYHTYLLKSKKKGSFYISYTKNINKRLKEHNTRLVEYTCSMGTYLL